MRERLVGNITGRKANNKVGIRTFRDNELVTGISILSVLMHTKRLEMSKCMLIEPLLSYTRVLKSLTRVNSSVKSIEDLILKQDVAFADFNARYRDSLILTINSILLFNELGLITLDNGFAVYAGTSFNLWESSLGNKASSRVKASKKLSEILSKGEASDFYLSLRIEI